MSDLRVMRDRHTALADALDRSGDLDSYASAAMIAITTTVDTYPTTAGAFYAVNPQRITGTVAEGASPTYATDPSTVVYALNVGSQIPPDGTELVIHSVGGRWCFRFDG
jgi:hypothetical protein